MTVTPPEAPGESLGFKAIWLSACTGPGQRIHRSVTPGPAPGAWGPAPGPGLSQPAQCDVAPVTTVALPQRAGSRLPPV